MAYLMGRKIGMTQTFLENSGVTAPVTVIKATPCKVLDRRTMDRDGYEASIIGIEEIEGAKVKHKARLGFFKKAGQGVYRMIREFRGAAVEPGTEYTVKDFAKGERVRLEGQTKGKGWASHIKRWNFGTGRESHGGKAVRSLGAVAMCQWPGRVLPGKKMSGRMGNNKMTFREVEVVGTVPEENLILVKGPVPGGRNDLVALSKKVEEKKTA